MPFVDEYILPLSQHIGAPAVPSVSPGEPVVRGQTIANAGGFVSTALHSPVTGTVRAIEPRPHPSGKLLPAIIIAADPYSRQRVHPADTVDPASLSNQELVSKIQQAGIVGLGGAAFPSHVKLSLPENKRIRFLVVNGCECEPYLTCDDRLMRERAAAVVRGAQILMDHLGAERTWVGIEANKPEAIRTIQGALLPSMDIVTLEVKYPQGAEKMLIKAILEEEVPSGGLPLDMEILVNNVGTMAAIADYLDSGIPLIERVVTVSGPGIAKPRSLLVPLGTPVSSVIDYCGGLLPEARQVVLGGPMMGVSQKDLTVPVIKGTSGILALSSPILETTDQYPCIRCGRCLDACALFLNPTRLAQLARAERIEELDEYHVLDCFECGSCSFVCPSRIPLVQWIRFGKALVRDAKRR